MTSLRHKLININHKRLSSAILYYQREVSFKMIEVRTTTEEEAFLLSEIQKQAFLPLYERYHDKGNPCLRGIEDIVKRLNSVYFRYFTIFEDEEVVGGVLYKCKGKGPFFEQLCEGEYYLQRIYIKPERQCRGIAQTAILLCEK